MASSSPAQCIVVGMLDNGVQGLTATALRCLGDAALVVGATRMLEMAEGHVHPDAIRRDLTGHLSEVPVWIDEVLVDGKSVVVLATGDPLCHGIGNYLIGRLGEARVRIIPNVSTVQWACAQFGIPWQGIHICSVHGKDVGEWEVGAGMSHGLYPVLSACEKYELVAVFTSPENTPDRIARMLVAEGLDIAWEMMIAEHLFHNDERMIHGNKIADIAGQKFADPNVVLLRRCQASADVPLFGLDDDRYRQRRPEKGLITKSEVRAVSLAKLGLRPDSVVWDIGAGSGSVGLEAARLCRDGWVYAMEKNAEDHAIAFSNRQTMGIHNYTLRHGKAPVGLELWPDPDAVFIGGSGGELEELIRCCLSRMKPDGRLVMNFTTIENLSLAVGVLNALEKGQWDVVQMQVSRSKPILNMHRMAAENPIWIVSVEKP